MAAATAEFVPRLALEAAVTDQVARIGAVAGVSLASFLKFLSGGGDQELVMYATWAA